MPYTPEVADEPSLSEVRTALKDAAQFLIEREKTESDKRDAAWLEDVSSARNFIKTYDSIAVAQEHAERNELEKSQGPQAALDVIEKVENRSAGRQVTENEAYTEWVKSGRDHRSFPAMEVRTLLDSAGDDNAALLRPVGTPYLPGQNVQQRRLFIRDVITTQQTNLASVPYLRELNSATNAGGATATAEGSAKAEAVMEFEQDDAPARKLTAWIPATSEILADAPTLRGYIDTRLTYMIKLREEAQILNGPGTAPNLKGIVQFTGVETQSAVNDDVPATIGLACSQIEANDGFASAVAMNPVDWWKGVVERHSSTFDNGGGGNAPAAVGGLTWGLPVVRTNAMTAGDALVGDFVLGATLFDREGVTVKTSDSHSTYFTENKVAIVAEERIALAVHRPDWFVDTTITFT